MSTTPVDRPPPAAQQLREDVVAQVERALDVGRTDLARRSLTPALAARPDDAGLLLLAARIEDAAGNGPEARRLVGEVLARDPGSWRGRLLHYQQLLEDDRHADAEQVILGLLREDPSNPPLIALYARLMLEALQLEKARALTDEALRLDPDDSHAQLLDALLHTVEGDDERASERVARQIARDPEAMHVARTAVVVFASGKRPKDALEIARCVLRAEPGDRALVNAIVSLRTQTHPLLLPYWPLQRWGWTASAVLWGVGIVGVRACYAISPRAGVIFTAVWLAYVVGSWVLPPLLRWHLRRVGA
jgi:predicted Zn-dependent protease